MIRGRRVETRERSAAQRLEALRWANEVRIGRAGARGSGDLVALKTIDPAVRPRGSGDFRRDEMSRVTRSSYRTIVISEGVARRVRAACCRFAETSEMPRRLLLTPKSLVLIQLGPLEKYLRNRPTPRPLEGRSLLRCRHSE